MVGVSGSEPVHCKESRHLDTCPREHLSAVEPRPLRCRSGRVCSRFGIDLSRSPQMGKLTLASPWPIPKSRSMRKAAASPTRSVSDSSDARSRAECSYDAFLAPRAASLAAPAAMPDEQVRKHRPTLTRKQHHQVSFDFCYVVVGGQREPT